MTTPRKTAAPKAPQTGADILGRVKPKRRSESTDICLRADLIAEFHEADAELTRLKAKAIGGINRLHPGAEAVAESDEYVAQAKKVRKIEDQIKDALVTFTFQAMNKDEWRALLDNHPPRKGNQMDHLVGYDRDTVLDLMVRQSLITPVFEDCDQAGCTHEDCGTWQQFVEVVNPSEWGELRDTANQANSAVVEAPFSELASLTLDKRASGSK